MAAGRSCRRAGWQAWVIDEAEHNIWTGTEWRRDSPLSSLGAERWGVNATADTTNRFAVSADASLFNHAGSDHRLKINKNAAGNTASLLFQSNWSGRAEFGLAGDDDFRVKVSADGSAWHDAVAIDRASGSVALPGSPWATAANLLVNGDMAVNQRGFAGGALAAGTYGFDRWKAATGGASLLLGGFTITLTSGAIIQPAEPALWGLSSFAGLPLTLSVENLTGGSLAVAIGSQSGAITAGAGRRSVTLTPAAGDTGVLQVQLSPSAGTVSFARIKLEHGPLATGWSARPRSVEQMLCRRYFLKQDGQVLIDAYQAAAAASRQSLTFPIPMRATPSVTAAVSLEVNVQGTDRGVVAQSSERAYAYVTAQALGRVRAAFDAITFDAEL